MGSIPVAGAKLSPSAEAEGDDFICILKINRQLARDVLIPSFWRRLLAPFLLESL